MPTLYTFSKPQKPEILYNGHCYLNNSERAHFCFAVEMFHKFVPVIGTYHATRKYKRFTNYYTTNNISLFNIGQFSFEFNNVFNLFV